MVDFGFPQHFYFLIRDFPGAVTSLYAVPTAAMPSHSTIAPRPEGRSQIAFPVPGPRYNSAVRFMISSFFLATPPRADTYTQVEVISANPKIILERTSCCYTVKV